MIPRRAVIVTAVFFGILIAIAIVLAVVRVVQSPKPDTSFTQPAATPKKLQNAISIDNINEHSSDIDSATIQTIEKNIYSYAKDTVDRPSSTYDGTIRSGSYSKSFPDGSTPVLNFLVDIPSIKRTYKVNLTGNSTTEEHILYIICPTSDELIYPAFACKDDFSGTSE